MKAPFKVLYSNDLTNVLTCVSPYHKRGEGFTRAMLEASVDETADMGIDVHMLQPGFGWFPLWQSKILSPAKHWDWLRKTYKIKAQDSFMKYLLDGGDIVSDFTQRCRQKGLSPFISLRMNDTHHLDNVDKLDIGGGQISVCEFYHDHPEYRLETVSNSWRDRGQNWAISVVREYKFNFIRELCENYDIDGIELDFMRAPHLFRSYETTFVQRRQIVTNFIQSVRKLLDKTSGNGKRYLCIKIPMNSTMFDYMGIDVVELASSGVDMFNLSYNYYTAQNGDLALIRNLASDTAMYVEMTNCTSIGRAVEKADGDTFEFKKTTDKQFYTTLSSAYAAGMDGCSLFNFVYYREHGSISRKGPVCEPPFGIIKNFRDQDFLRQQNACYFIGSHWQDDGPLPKAVSLFGQYADFLFQNVSCPRNINRALLKIYIDNERCGDWEAWFNDHPVCMSADSPILTSAKKVLTWEIPADIIVDGENRFELRSENVECSIIDFVEFVIYNN